LELYIEVRIVKYAWGRGPIPFHGTSIVLLQTFRRPPEPMLRPRKEVRRLDRFGRSLGLSRPLPSWYTFFQSFGRCVHTMLAVITFVSDERFGLVNRPGWLVGKYDSRRRREACNPRPQYSQYSWPAGRELNPAFVDLEAGILTVQPSQPSVMSSRIFCQTKRIWCGVQVNIFVYADFFFSAFLGVYRDGARIDVGLYSSQAVETREVTHISFLHISSAATHTLQ
jgi:hypothetical protein